MPTKQALRYARGSVVSRLGQLRGENARGGGERVRECAVSRDGSKPSVSQPLPA